MTFDEKELVEATKHLAFDMYHFRCYARIYNTRMEQPHRQAVIYALLLHFRVLLDFFYGKPTKDDVSVRHFDALPNFAARFRPVVPPSNAAQVSNNLNKRLAHLTATRWRQPAPDMKYYEGHFAAIETLIKAFVAALPKNARAVFDKRTQELEMRDRRA